ncbi:MAG: fasciclin domain-containing protein [Chitinophagales bacterium]|nr:fasciclin domain-containing protein [Chitinophagales bacterium]
MKTPIRILFLATFVLVWAFNSCTQSEQATPQTQTAVVEETQPAGGGQSAVKDDESAKDIVKVAAGSADHSTLVAAIQAASLVDALSNAGPFTVFAPTNAAFNALPAGTVDNLLKPENKEQLRTILFYHVTPGVYLADALKDGQKLGMVNSQNATVSVKDGKVQINGINVVGSVRASNGIIHVVDAVMLPPASN